MCLLQASHSEHHIPEALRKKNIPLSEAQGWDQSEGVCVLQKIRALEIRTSLTDNRRIMEVTVYLKGIVTGLYWWNPGSRSSSSNMGLGNSMEQWYFPNYRENELVSLITLAMWGQCQYPPDDCTNLMLLTYGWQAFSRNWSCSHQGNEPYLETSWCDRMSR